MDSLLKLPDYLTLIAYFLLVFLVAFASIFRNKEGLTDSPGAYFLGGRNIGWFVIGASLFASNIGSEHLVGLAGAGARGDFVSGQFELLASLILLVLAWLFVPFYLRSGVFTMPEFLEKRYSRSARTYLSAVSILSYVLTKISVTIFAGALVFELLLGIDFWTGAVIVVLATGLYTVLGGLRAVVYTDMLQMFVLIAGSIAVTYYGLQALGGVSGMQEVFAGRLVDSSRFFNLWRPASDPDFPWTGIVFGAPILGIWYWCTDQFIVQRVLSARNLAHAQRGAIFAGYLKLLPLFLFVVPGAVAYAIHLQGAGILEVNGALEYDRALPALILYTLPTGVKGLVVAGLLAALMSSLSSVFNSCSTLFTIDFYKKWKPASSERELVFVGQLSTAVLVVIALMWIPMMRILMEGGGIYQYLQNVQAYISPPIAAVFLFGLFFRRIHARAAMASLWTGFALGLGRLLLEVLAGKGIWSLPQSSLLSALVQMNFLHYAIFIFLICTIVLFLVGYRSAAKESVDESLIFKKSNIALWSEQKVNFILSISLILLVIFIWLTFSKWGVA